ncbi:MAG TPA: PLDc N-terminal domain-containing protein [Pyrinomonadaceae bacterium]|nr:PLDc N-terminal domain-containing protein [Pyrinomonadaceae bacterium]
MAFAGIGGLLMFIGTIWLIIVAIQTGQTTGEKVLWALVNFFCQPIGGIVFFFVRKQGLIPLILVIIGSVLFGAGYGSMMNDFMKNMPR